MLKGLLIDHIALVHERKNLHRCTICEKSFATKQVLQEHFDCVHDERKAKQIWLINNKKTLQFENIEHISGKSTF